MPTPYEDKQKQISDLSGGKGYAFLTTAQKEQINTSAPSPVSISEPVKTPTIISTTQAVNDLKKTQDTAQRIGGQPPVIPTTQPTEQPQPETTPTPTKPTAPLGLAYEDVIASGSDISTFDRQTDGTYLPKTTKTPEEIQLAKAEAQSEKDKLDLQNQINNLKNLDVSQDPALQREMNSITNAWNTRIEDMKRITESRTKSLTQQNIRLGGRYTEMFSGGIITEEERQGQQRIAELESQKQSALTQAQSSFRKQKWDEYSKFVDIAEKSYDKSIAELTKLNEKVVARNKEIKDAEALEEKNYYDRVQKPINDIMLEVAKGGKATPELIDAINNSESLSEAITLAGSSLKVSQNLPTNIQEYLFDNEQRKASGLVERTFDEWNNIDANRKAKVASAQNAGLISSAQSSLVNTVSSSFESSPIVKDFITIQSKYKGMKANAGQGNGATDIALIYDFMKTLDPESVVRETEYETGASKSGNIFVGAMAKFNGMIDPKGGFISETAKQNIFGVIDKKFNISKETYEHLRKEKIKTLENRGVPDAGQFLTEYNYESPQNETNKGIGNENEAKNSVIEYSVNNPKDDDLIQGMIKDGIEFTQIQEWINQNR